MHTLILLSETVAHEEEASLPLAISLAVAAFVGFSILLFAVTRLNPDR
jgi:hypothetical protein